MTLSRRKRGRGEIEIDPNIKLYHGSSVVFERPRADVNVLPCDFGRGFYMTEDKERARRRAVEKMLKGGGKGFVLEYDFDDEAAFRDSKKGRPYIKWFEEDKEWLDFVERNWDGRYVEMGDHTSFDGIIIGPSSDYRIADVLDKYRKSPRGDDDVEKALRDLDLAAYGKQYFFGSQEAIDKYLKYVGATEVRMNVKGKVQPGGHRGVRGAHVRRLPRHDRRRGPGLLRAHRARGLRQEVVGGFRLRELSGYDALRPQVA